MFRRGFLSGLIAFFLSVSFGAYAETAPDRLDVLQSEWYADRSDGLLRQGDRAGAILAALHGIPSDPVAQDEETYVAAFAALFRAVASRAFRTDLLAAQIVIWSPDGTRAVSESVGDGVDSPRMNGAILWDAITSARIADLTPPREWAESVTLPIDPAVSPFSPDSRLLALAESRFDAFGPFEGQVSVHDAVTGGFLGRVPGDFFLGFSVDGSLFLVTSLYSSEVRMFDSQRLTEVGRLSSEEVGGDLIVSGFPDATGGFTLVLTDEGDARGANVNVRLARIDRAGSRILADIADLPGDAIAASWPIAINDPVSGHTLLAPDTGEVFVIDNEARVTGRVAFYHSGLSRLAFVRGGRAFAVQQGFGFDNTGLGGLRVFDLTGTELAPQAMDVVPFLDWITDDGGRLVGLSDHGSRVGAGRVTSQGATLYAEVWPQIPPALQEQIVSDRVQRP